MPYVGGTKSMTKNKPAGHGLAEQLPKMRELMEDFWELRGLIFQSFFLLYNLPFPGDLLLQFLLGWQVKLVF